MKLLVDMNLSPRWIAILADAGIAATHWSDVGAHDAADKDIMAHASENGYVVLTHDLDFSAILAATQGEKPRVVQVRAEDGGDWPADHRRDPANGLGTPIRRIDHRGTATHSTENPASSHERLNRISTYLTAR